VDVRHVPSLRAGAHNHPPWQGRLGIQTVCADVHWRFGSSEKSHWQVQQPKQLQQQIPDGQSSTGPPDSRSPNQSTNQPLRRARAYSNVHLHPSNSAAGAPHDNPCRRPPHCTAPPTPHAPHPARQHTHTHTGTHVHARVCAPAGRRPLSRDCCHPSTCAGQWPSPSILETTTCMRKVDTPQIPVDRDVQPQTRNTDTAHYHQTCTSSRAHNLNAFV
jgi:hypothetical protein